MIAAASLRSGLAPEAFLGPFGAVMLSILQEQAQEEKKQNLLAKARSAWGRH